MSFRIDCDGVDSCMNGTFDCDNCSGKRAIKPVVKKPKHKSPVQKQFKCRKK